MIHSSSERRRKIRKALRHWLAQGLFYAHPTERIYKILFELLFLGLLIFILIKIFKLNHIFAVFVAIFTTHNINFIVNGSFWETMVCDLGLKGPGKRNLVNYLKDMRERHSKYSFIESSFVYGSLARGELHDGSDLDAVIVRRRGFINSIKGIALLAHEKFLALEKRITLELYLADDLSWLKRIRNDEIPVVIDDKYGELKKYRNRLQSIEEAEKGN